MRFGPQRRAKTQLSHCTCSCTRNGSKRTGKRIWPCISWKIATFGVVSVCRLENQTGRHARCGGHGFSQTMRTATARSQLNLTQYHSSLAASWVFRFANIKEVHVPIVRCLTCDLVSRATLTASPRIMCNGPGQPQSRKNRRFTAPDRWAGFSPSRKAMHGRT